MDSKEQGRSYSEVLRTPQPISTMVVLTAAAELSTMAPSTSKPVPKINVSVVENGNVVFTYEKPFPVELLMRYSLKARDDLKNNKNAKTFYIYGDIPKAPLVYILGWMDANRNVKGPTSNAEELNPENLPFFHYLKVYQAAKAFRIVPYPNNMRAHIITKIESEPIEIHEMGLILDNLAVDTGLITKMLIAVAKFYVAGKLDDKIPDLEAFFDPRPQLQARLEKEIEGNVGYMQRKARRERLGWDGVVHKKWKDNEEE